MRRHLILFFLALFLLAACKDDKRPAGIIAKEKMPPLMRDVHVIDGSLILQNSKDSLYKYGTNRYQLLFKRYGIDSNIFKKSVKYYSARPDDMIDIYEEVVKLLTKKSDSTAKAQAKIMAKEVKDLEDRNKTAAKKRTDSLKRDSIKMPGSLRLRIRQSIK